MQHPNADKRINKTFNNPMTIKKIHKVIKIITLAKSEAPDDFTSKFHQICKEEECQSYY